MNEGKGGGRREGRGEGVASGGLVECACHIWESRVSLRLVPQSCHLVPILQRVELRQL